VHEPDALAQRIAVSGQEPDSISQEDPDFIPGGEPDSFAVAGPDSLFGYEPNSNSGRQPDSVADQIAIA